MTSIDLCLLEKLAESELKVGKYYEKEMMNYRKKLWAGQDSNNEILEKHDEHKKKRKHHLDRYDNYLLEIDRISG